MTPDQQGFKNLYREFIRVTKYIPKLKYQTIYKSYLKKYFISESAYLKRRATVLSKGHDFKPITNSDILERLPKTLSFVQLSCQYEKNEINSTIFRNLLKFEESKLNYIEKNKNKDVLLSHKFDNFDHFKKIEKKDDLGSLREMERLIMRLNETEEMCL